MEERPEVTLVYAHGCSFSKDMWTPVLGRLKKFPVVQRVATKFVTFDFPFHGSRSDKQLAETLEIDTSSPKAPRVRGAGCDDVKNWYLKIIPEQVGG